MSENGKTVEVTDGNFASVIEGSKGSPSLISGAWCGPCRLVALSSSSWQPSTPASSRSTSWTWMQPTDRDPVQHPVDSDILFFMDGKHVDTVVGAVPRTMLERKIQQHLERRRPGPGAGRARHSLAAPGAGPRPCTRRRNSTALP
jgi:thioredoxin 1